MKLEVSHGRGANPANSSDVEQALRGLRDNDDAFVILSRDPDNYLQANAESLEYCAHGNQHRAAGFSLSDHAALTKVFLAYLRGDDEFRQLAQWEAFEIPPAQPRKLKHAGLVAAVIFVIAAVLTARWAGLF